MTDDPMRQADIARRTQEIVGAATPHMAERLIENGPKTTGM
jgi:hypothetical protein